MPPVIDRDLTDRQRAVLGAIDRRLPLKLVAAELGISESRVNQHVRGLKERYGVNNLPDLVDAWRNEDAGGYSRAAEVQDPCRNPPWRNPQVSGCAFAGENERRVAPGEFVLSDAALIAIEAPWMGGIEPRVVPGVLDGDNAVLLRLAVIVGLAFGIIAAVVLVVTASLSLSEALDGTASLAPNTSEPVG